MMVERQRRCDHLAAYFSQQRYDCLVQGTVAASSVRGMTDMRSQMFSFVHAEMPCENGSAP